MRTAFGFMCCWCSILRFYFFSSLPHNLCFLRWIVSYESEKFPSIILEQLLPALSLLYAGQRSVCPPLRDLLPRGPLLLHLPAQPPAPAQPWHLAPITPPPPPSPPPLLARGRHKHSELALHSSRSSRDVRRDVRPKVRLSAGAVGEVASQAVVWQLRAGNQHLAVWPGGKGGVRDGVGVERCLHWSRSRDRTQHRHRY